MPLKQMLCLVAIALAFVTPGAAQDAPSAPAIEPARLEAAKELIDVTGAKKQIELMLDVMKQGLGRGARETGNPDAAAKLESEFQLFSQKFQGYREKMVDEFAALYAEKFTADELKEITAFYRSGTGAKFIASMPDLMQRGGLIGQRYGAMAVRELEAMRKKP